MSITKIYLRSDQIRSGRYFTLPEVLRSDFIRSDPQKYESNPKISDQKEQNTLGSAHISSCKIKAHNIQ